jgi:hypothetical protein
MQRQLQSGYVLPTEHELRDRVLLAELLHKLDGSFLTVCLKQRRELTTIVTDVHNPRHVAAHLARSLFGIGDGIAPKSRGRSPIMHIMGDARLPSVRSLGDTPVRAG